MVLGSGRSMPTKALAGAKERVAVLTLVKTCANVACSGWRRRGRTVFLAAGVAR